MAFDTKTSTKLLKLFEGINYRKVVSERANVHPNTVTNVLHGNDNPTVELEILLFAKEIMDEKDEDGKKRKRAREIIKQL